MKHLLIVLAPSLLAATFALLAAEEPPAPPRHCPFPHALLDDLAFALQQPLAFVDNRHADPRTCCRGGSLLRHV